MDTRNRFAGVISTVTFGVGTLVMLLVLLGMPVGVISVAPVSVPTYSSFEIFKLSSPFLVLAVVLHLVFGRPSLRGG